MFGQLHTGGRIDRIANLLGGGGGGFDVEIPLAMSFADEFLHHKFCHGTAADIAVADEEYASHFSVFFNQTLSVPGFTIVMLLRATYYPGDR